jgi:uncharacterized protein (TIGR02246 family)
MCGNRVLTKSMARVRRGCLLGILVVGAHLFECRAVFAQAAPADPSHAPDESEIRLIVDEEVAAWNAGDAQAYARHFAVDGTFTNIYGMVFEGHDDFERRHAETFGSFFKGGTRRETIRRLKFIAPTVALVDVDTEVRGFGIMPVGVPTPADGVLRTHLRQVLVKGQAGWTIASYHNVAIAAPQQ